MSDTHTLDTFAKRLAATNGDDLAAFVRELRLERTEALGQRRNNLTTWYDVLLLSLTSAGTALRARRLEALTELSPRDLSLLVVRFGRDLARCDVNGGQICEVKSAILTEIRGELARRKSGMNVTIPNWVG